MLKKSIHIIIIVISIVLLVSFSYANAVENDVNAADIYIKAPLLLTALPADFIIKANEIINNGWRDDNSGLREILIKNQEALSEFKKAAKLNYCEFNFGGSAKENYDVSFPLQFKDVGTLARLALIEGRFYEQENKFNLALENYFLVLQFANHLAQQKRIVLLNNIHGKIWRKYSCQILAQYIRREAISNKEYYYILNRVISLRDNSMWFKDAVEGEKGFNKYSARAVKNKIEIMYAKKTFFIDTFYKEYDKLADEYFQQLITAFKENNVKKMTEEFGKKHGFLVKSNPLSPFQSAKYLFSLGLYGYGNFVEDYYIQQAKFDMLILSVALKLYNRENNKFPLSLQDLVPQYLPEIPKDPFNKFNLLQYKKTDAGWIVYSFGPDRQDNHGDFQFEEKDLKNKTGDIVFSSF